MAGSSRDRVIEGNDPSLYCSCPQDNDPYKLCRCSAEGHAVLQQEGGGNDDNTMILDCFGMRIRVTRLDVSALSENIKRIVKSVSENLDDLRTWLAQRLVDYELHIYRRSNNESFDLQQTFLRVSNAADTLKKGQRVIDNWFAAFTSQANQVRLLLVQDYALSLQDLQNHCSEINLSLLGSSNTSGGNSKLARKIISMRKRSTTLLNRYINKTKKFIEEFQQLIEMIESFNQGCIIESERQKGRRNIVKRKCFDLSEMLRKLDEYLGDDQQSPLERVRTHLADLIVGQKSEIDRLMPREVVDQLSTEINAENPEIERVTNSQSLIVSNDLFEFFKYSQEFLDSSIYRPVSKARLDKMMLDLREIIDNLDDESRRTNITKLLDVTMGVVPARTPENVKVLLQREFRMANTEAQYITLRVRIKKYLDNLIERDVQTRQMLESLLQDVNLQLDDLSRQMDTSDSS